jgi:hypothetical protein
MQRGFAHAAQDQFAAGADGGAGGAQEAVAVGGARAVEDVGEG